MFNSCKNLKNIDLQYFNTTIAEDMSYMFFDCNKLISLDLSNLITYNVETFSNMFGNCKSLTEIDFNLDATRASDLSYLFYGCSNLKVVNMSSSRTTKDVNMEYMFFNCEQLVEIDFGSNNFAVTAIAYAFHGCTNLPNIDFTNFDVREVTDMRSLFYGCKALTELNLRTFRTTICHLFTDMFAETNEMNVTIYRNLNPELCESAPKNIHFLEMMHLKLGVLLDE